MGLSILTKHRNIRRGMMIVVSILLGSPGLMLASCADAGPYNPGQLAASDHAQVAGLCTGVIGLPAGNEQYNACLEALSASVHDLSDGQALVSSRAECLRQRLPVGSPALAECELNRSGDDQPRRQVVAVLPNAPPMRGEPNRNYWSASNAEIHHREQIACARLGLEPVSGAFAQCVASLDVGLFAATYLSQ